MNESDQNTTPGATQGSSSQSGMGTQAKQQAHEAKDQARQAAGEAKNQAQEIASEAREQAMRMADEKKGVAADQVGGVAKALRSMGDRFKEQDQVSFADYTYKIADQAESFAGSLRDNDLNTIWRQAQECSRHRPMVYLGGAIAAGFFLSRFLKSGGSGSTQQPR